MNLPWPPDAYTLHATPATLLVLAPIVYQRVCRRDFTQPGFCLVNLGTDLTSSTFRELMVRLQQALSDIHAKQGQHIVFLAAARFDQQTTTKAHLDGGPEESLLLLGYEPSAIAANVAITDYTRAAHEHNLTPTQFMEQHNPMFRRGQELLQPYTTTLTTFTPAAYQMLLVNNSNAPYEDGHWQGTLHAATIPHPDETQRRIINSTLLTTAPLGTTAGLSAADLADFCTTTQVRRQGYDKLHLADDV